MNSDRTKVCLVVDSLRFDAGTEKLVPQIAARLDTQQFEVHVCCLENSSRLEELRPRCRTAVFPADRLNSLNGLRQIRCFRRYLNENRIDVVHAFMTKSAILSVAAGSRSRCRAVVTGRLSIDWYTPALAAFFRYYMNPRTTRILANSEGVKEVVAAVEHAPPGKIDVIYQGVDVPRFSSGDGSAETVLALGIPADAKVVGIVANYRPVKDLPLFLRAAALVAAEVPRTAFLLVGHGPLHGELLRLSAGLGIAGSVFFSAGKGAVPDYLRRMSIGCLSSQSEGFSNAILEYMAAGLPVIATDVGGNGEAICHGETGFLVKNRTPESFAAPIVALLQDEERRCAMGRRAFERCRVLYSMDACVDRLQTYYRELAGTA